MHAAVMVFAGLVASLLFEISSGGVVLSETTNHRHEVDEKPPTTPQDDIYSEPMFSVFQEMQRGRYADRDAVRPVRPAIAALMSSFAEAFSALSAVPIVAAISFVNRVANVTNQTLHISGELTKLPVTITNSIINELSNITFPH